MFEAMFFGHFIGDYLFQTDWMASNKNKNTWNGALACFIHCLVYALSVKLSFMVAGIDDWRIFTIAFVCHYPIDRSSLGAKWMKLMQQVPPNEVIMIDDFAKREARKMFSPIVYVVVDNMLHLILMWSCFHLWL